MSNLVNSNPLIQSEHEIQIQESLSTRDNSFYNKQLITIKIPKDKFKKLSKVATKLEKASKMLCQSVKQLSNTLKQIKCVCNVQLKGNKKSSKRSKSLSQPDETKFIKPPATRKSIKPKKQTKKGYFLNNLTIYKCQVEETIKLRETPKIKKKTIISTKVQNIRGNASMNKRINQLKQIYEINRSK